MAPCQGDIPWNFSPRNYIIGGDRSLIASLGAVLKLDRVVVMTGISSGCLCMISIEKSPPQVVGVQPKAEDE